ncbi:flagellar filament capping protein FliD [Brenneria tiliae]|uniref:flagellar filament capping protein FliD n=1 Tax=Brenneria tiliae TaxID=2914984 RepID=UPI002014942C|nr:flagellar filament capping protein FliD [Brenneria tiliae]MCL2899844.1 flagellar filament capping protein FliD [Brenneria tiliae]MCL2904667.1 flagellar filament capping protein FliD [Brenneria tiliae]
MASVTSSLGVGSGLDLTSILEKLQAVEDQKVTVIENKQTAYTNKTTAYNTLSSALETLSSAADALTDSSLYNSKATTTNTAFSTSATSDAVTGSYSINVSQLATAQSLVSGTQSDKTSALSSSDSTLTISVGGTTTEISLTADQTSLNGLVSAINSAGAGVTASVIQSGDSSYQLVLTSDDTGEASTMTISSTDDTLNSIIGYDSTTASGAMSEAVAAQDAELTVNGISVTRSSNTITDVPSEGVTLTLTAVSTSTETLTVSANTDELTTAIQTWVDTYNSLLSTFTTLTAYNEEYATDDDSSTNNGALIGDSLLRGVKNKLKSLLSAGQDNNTYQVLSQLGISVSNSDGTISIDSSALSSALSENADDVKAFFVGDGSTSGLATLMVSTIETYTADDGLIDNALDGITEIQQKLTAKKTATEARIEAIMARYTAQFTALDVLISELDSTSTYLTNVFEQLSSSD